MKKGYTLIELMLVCTIVLFLCTIGIPHFFNKSSHDLTYELNKIEIILKFLQQRALATNQTQTIVIDPTIQTFTWIINNQKITHTLTPTLKFGFLPQSYGPPSDPTALITDSITFKQINNFYYIELFPNGKISSGSIYLIDKNRIIMGALTSGISQVSYIRRYVYKSKAQQWLHYTS